MRLVSRWVAGKATGHGVTRPRARLRARRYTSADAALLIDVDRAMGTL